MARRSRVIDSIQPYGKYALLFLKEAGGPCTPSISKFQKFVLQHGD